MWSLRDQELTNDFLALLFIGDAIVTIPDNSCYGRCGDGSVPMTWIEPLDSPYVYAIGLTQERFPKIAQNTSLLSEERTTTAE